MDFLEAEAQMPCRKRVISGADDVRTESRRLSVALARGRREGESGVNGEKEPVLGIGAGSVPQSV